MPHQAGLVAADPGGPPGLAEVLARETCGYEIDRRKRVQSGDVVMEVGSRKVMPEHLRRGAILLAQEDGLMPRGAESDLYAADAGE